MVSVVTFKRSASSEDLIPSVWFTNDNIFSRRSEAVIVKSFLKNWKIYPFPMYGFILKDGIAKCQVILLQIANAIVKNKKLRKNCEIY